MSSLRDIIIISGLALVLASSYGCIDPPDFAIEPKIEFAGLSKDTLLQGVFQQDSLILSFTFEDGDGDLGREDNATENNVFLIDTRTNSMDNAYGIPFIPAQGSSNGIEGTVQLLLFSTCCLYDSGQDPCTPSQTTPYDSLQYELYIVDRAGNESNRITTPVITLICN